MNWLKDKKNLPLIIVAAVVLVAAVVVGVLFGIGVLPPQSQSASNPAPAAGTPAAPATTAPPTPGTQVASRPAPGPAAAPGAPPAASPAAPATPATARSAAAMRPHGPAAKAAGKLGAKTTAGTTATGLASAALTPTLAVAETPDPFRLPGSTVQTIQQLRQQAAAPTPQVLPPLPDPTIAVVHPTSTQPNNPNSTNAGVPPPPTGPQEAGSNMRMAGVLYGNGIWALLEVDGNTKEVQPGDSTDAGRVVSIEPNAMILKTPDGRLLRVPLSANPTGGQAASFGGGQ